MLDISFGADFTMYFQPSERESGYHRCKVIRTGLLLEISQVLSGLVYITGYTVRDHTASEPEPAESLIRYAETHDIVLKYVFTSSEYFNFDSSAIFSDFDNDGNMLPPGLR
jgi:hypothetical protein